MHLLPTLWNLICWSRITLQPMALYLPQKAGAASSLYGVSSYLLDGMSVAVNVMAEVPFSSSAVKKSISTKIGGIWDSKRAGFAQAVAINGSSTRIVVSAQSDIVAGGGKAEQLEKAFENIKSILQDLSVTLDDAVEFNLLIKDYSPSDLVTLAPVWTKYMKSNAASSLLGVSQLPFPNTLVSVNCKVDVPTAVHVLSEFD